MSLAAILGAASGGLLVLVGLGLLAAKPQREGGLIFSLFVIVWGCEVAIINLPDLVASTSLQQTLLALALGLSIAEVLFLVHFIVRFSRGDLTGNGWWTWVAAGLAVVVGASFALNPGWYVGGFNFTTAGVLLILVPKFAAFYVTLHLLAARYFGEPGLLERREVAIVFGALSLYASYTAGFFLLQYGLDWSFFQTNQGTVSAGAFLLLFAVATAFLLDLARRFWSEHRSRQDPEDSLDGLLAASILLPLGAGVLTATPNVLGYPWIDLFGLLRIGTVLLIAYGLLKYQIFAIDLKLKTGVKRSTVIGSFVLVFFLASEGVEAVASGAWGTWAGLGAAGALTLALRPLERSATAVADRLLPGVGHSDTYLQQRRTEVYTAAVERAARDERLDERERRVLDTLAQDLGIPPPEATRIEQRIFAGAAAT